VGKVTVKFLRDDACQKMIQIGQRFTELFKQ